MAFPTWHGGATTHDQEFEAIMGSWDVLKEMLGSRFLDRPPQELVHAIEASARIYRIAESSQDTLVPIARAHGVSWRELGAALGISPTTARRRYGDEDEIEGWKESLHRRPEGSS